MKSLRLLFLLSFVITIHTTNIQAQNVTIPDSIFQAALVADTLINTNQDSFIQVSEAQAYTGMIDVSNLNISDLTGIEAFTALTSLYCYNNQLTNLNVSTNMNLGLVWCFGNQLTNLTVSGDTALTDLRCGNNLLTSLDVTNNNWLATLWCFHNQLDTLALGNNAMLMSLNCDNNQLTNLDLSMNSSLTTAICSNNQLNDLNIKNNNNSAIPGSSFNATNNPNLSCIMVSDTAYTMVNWPNIDAGAVFSVDLAGCLVSVHNIPTALQNSRVYPNPTTQQLNIDLNESFENIRVEVRNAIGQLVAVNHFELEQFLSIELQGNAGIYWLRILTEAGEKTFKVIKG